jgi:hypothetical protein
LTLDSSGNLGLGVTPTTIVGASGVNGQGFQTNSLTISAYAGTDQTYFATNANTTSYTGGWTYRVTAAATRYDQSSGSHIWYNAPSGTAGNAISFTQAMTLDANGDLLVGTTLNGGNAKLKAKVSAGVTGLEITDEATSDFIVTPAISANVCRVGPSAGAMAFYCNTERARITSGGDLLVGTNTALNGTARLDVNALTGNNVAATLKNDAGANQWTAQVWNAGTSGDNAFIQFATETAYTGRGSITYNRAGGLVAYNTTSDYRAKDVTGPVANSGATIDALKVYNGKMKGATVERPMLIAHEAQEVTPYAVTGEKDAVEEDGKPKYQQMDVSSLVPLLIAEIQSLRARVAQLEAK